MPEEFHSPASEHNGDPKIYPFSSISILPILNDYLRTHILRWPKRIEREADK